MAGKYTKLAIVLSFSAVLAVMPLFSVQAVTYILPNISDPTSILCDTLNRIGLFCFSGSNTQLVIKKRVSLIRSSADRNKIYYLTETGFKRLIPSNDILDSYGDKKSDIVTVSEKKISFYPDNQYVYVLDPYNPDVFKIDGKYKYYLTPMAITRLGIRSFEVAPINKFEFDYYKYGRPITE